MSVLVTQVNKILDFVILEFHAQCMKQEVIMNIIQSDTPVVYSAAIKDILWHKVFTVFYLLMFL
jgi:hypothetical protein